MSILKGDVHTDKWKLATVTPLKRDGFVYNVSDLRPISMLTLPANILEKILHSQLITFLND